MSSMMAPGVRETTGTTGTGTLTLAPVTGSVEFSQAFADGTRVCYALKNGNNWEWGTGTVGAGKTLARTIPLVTYVGGVFNSTSPTAISLVGTSEVFCSGAHNVWMYGPAGISSNTVLGLRAGGSAGTTGSGNTAVGYYTQYSLTAGSGDIAVGQYAQYSLTDGSGDVAIGQYTQYNITTGSYNIAVGGYAQHFLTTGGGNTAVGQNAQRSLTTGGENIAVGQNSQRSITTGGVNTAVGNAAQYSITTGIGNVAVGNAAQYSLTDGSNDIAVGRYAQYSITTGSGDIAVGQYAQYSITTGSNNTAVGYYAQNGLTTGENNLSIGASSGKNITSGSGNITIGGMNSAGNYVPVFDITTQNNVISLGSTATTAAHINVAWTVVSDERDKTVIEALPHGLDIVESLRPVSYQRRTARGEGGDGRVRWGLIAQEVLAIEGAAPIVDQADPDRLGLNSDYIIPVLVRAVQQLAARLEELEEMIDG